jgi:hypothetical protein
MNARRCVPLPAISGTRLAEHVYRHKTPGVGRVRRLLGAGLVAAALASPAAAAGGVERNSLRETSVEIVELYNRTDAAALHEKLTPGLRRTWAVGDFAQRLDDCRRRFGVLNRISLPVSGTRFIGLITAYFETEPRDMFLELDRDGLIRTLTFVGLDDSCALSQPQGP